jgi:hypothetical protein
MTRWYISLTADYERIIEAETLADANNQARFVIERAQAVMPNGWKFDTLEICETLEKPGKVTRETYQPDDEGQS